MEVMEQVAKHFSTRSPDTFERFRTDEGSKIAVKPTYKSKTLAGRGGIQYVRLLLIAEIALFWT